MLEAAANICEKIYMTANCIKHHQRASLNWVLQIRVNWTQQQELQLNMMEKQLTNRHKLRIELSRLSRLFRFIFMSWRHKGKRFGRTALACQVLFLDRYVICEKCKFTFVCPKRHKKDQFELNEDYTSDAPSSTCLLYTSPSPRDS